MLLSANNKIRGKVLDLDTGLWVRKVIELNTDTGYLKAYFVKTGCAHFLQGCMACKPDCTDATHGLMVIENNNAKMFEAHGRFKFVPRQVALPKQEQMGAAKCAKCPSTLVLQGDDLCPACRAKERGQRNPMKVEKLDSFEIKHKCDRCSRDASYAVSDEVAVTPSTSGFSIVQRGTRKLVVPTGTGNQQWLRGATVGRRYYCQRCYKPPALVDSKGEVIKELETRT